MDNVIASNNIDIAKGSKILELEFRIKYKGINENQYEEYEKYRYDNIHDVFVPVESSFK